MQMPFTRHLKQGAIIAAAIALAGSASAASAAGEVKVVVTGVKASEGTVHAMVCPEPLWLKTCPIGADAPAKQGTTTVTVPNVPPGRYGVVAFHDRNGNGKADRNMIGMPTEDVGFSNDALKGLSKPKFAVAAFNHTSAGQTITLKLNDFSR